MLLVTIAALFLEIYRGLLASAILGITMQLAPVCFAAVSCQIVQDAIQLQCVRIASLHLLFLVGCAFAQQALT